MHIIFPQVTGALLVLCRGAFAATLPSNSSSTYLEQGATAPLTTIPDLPGDDFSFVIESFRLPLVEIPSVMVCIWAMRELAMLRFRDEFVPERDWTHPRFPQVRLTVVPPAGKDDISVRFAMWVITATMRLMLEAENFQSIHSLGYFRNRAIGSITLTPSRAIGVLYNSSSHHISPPQHEQPPNTAGYFPFGHIPINADSISSANDQLHAEVEYRSTMIDRRDIFFGVTWFILECAPHNEEPLTVWRVTPEAISSHITIVWNRVRQTRYQMTMGDVVSFLAYLPEVLLEQGMFREMDIAIKNGDVTVARGSFRARPNSRLMELSSSMSLNVTKS